MICRYNIKLISLRKYLQSRQQVIYHLKGPFKNILSLVRVQNIQNNYINKDISLTMELYMRIKCRNHLNYHTGLHILFFLVRIYIGFKNQNYSTRDEILIHFNINYAVIYCIIFYFVNLDILILKAHFIFVRLDKLVIPAFNPHI